MSEQLPRFKAAAIQAAPVFLDRDATLEKATSLVEEAAKQGASLVVFPETWVPGYPFWYTYVSRFNYPPGKRAYARLYKNSVDVPGKFTEVLGQVAKRTGTYVVMGVNERVASGTLYNTLVFFGRDGSLLGKHRKLIPTFHERMVWSQGDASTLQVFNTELGNLGGLICWEHWMPLARYALYAQGMQVCASTWPASATSWPPLNNTPTSLAASQHLAHEGRCFVVRACGYLTKAHIPRDFELAQDIVAAPDIIYRGGSTIIGPDFKCLVDPVYDQETIVYADIDLERILEEKQTLDVVGHYARPEVFKLTINRQPFSALPTVTDAVDIVEELRQLEKLAGEVSREVLQDKIHRLRELLRPQEFEGKT